MTAVNRTSMDSATADISSSSLWRTATSTDPTAFDGSFISSWRDHHHPSHPHEIVVHHDYPSFRFPDSHHHYDAASSYYADAAAAAAMDSYASSSAAAAAYSPYMVHHHSPPTANSTHPNSGSIKPESAAAAFQTALSLPAPMNVNVSMNFNSHSVQYTAGYGVPSASNFGGFTSSNSTTGNSPYDPFYGSAVTGRHNHQSSSSHHPFVSHHHISDSPMSPEVKHSMSAAARSSSYLQAERVADAVATKQAMLLSAAASYDYKDLSKLCDLFPTPSSSTSTAAGLTPTGTSGDKRKTYFRRSPWLPPQSTSKSSSSSNKTNEGRINRCRICGKIYARPSTLKTHLRTHSGEKPYKCDKCCKAFTQAANLTAHLRTHSGEKPFSCDICGRKFSQSSSVTTHMRTHSGERPYQCRYCRKAFSDSSTLTKHTRVHSGEKPYECSLCRLRFSQSGNLNRHMRIHMNGGHHSK